MEEYWIELLVLVVGQLFVIVMQENKIRKLTKEMNLYELAANSRLKSQITALTPRPTIFEYWEYNEPKELVKFLKDSKTMSMRVISGGGNGSKYWIVYELFDTPICPLE